MAKRAFATLTMGGGNIILVGMMCSGKSAAGRALAKMLRRPFADIDGNIEKRGGKTIAAIFASGGEKAFRQLENRELRRALKKGRQVVATGGGIVCAPDNIRQMRADNNNVVCYLRAPVTVLAKRAAAAGLSARPLLAECRNIGAVRGVLTGIFAERKAHYERAAHCIADISSRHGENDTAAAIIRAILSAACFRA